jgi:Domain of unknown function (DUF4267)
VAETLRTVHDAAPSAGTVSFRASSDPDAMIARPLAGVGAVCVLGIGAAALVWPQRSTSTYGIPADDEDTLAYVRAAAARDLVMGLFILRAALADDRKAMEAGLAACIIAPAADLILARERRGNIPQLAIHGAGVVGIFAVWALVRAGL